MKLKKLGLAIAAMSVITACGGGSGNTPAVEAPKFNLETAKEVIETNADIAAAVYKDSVDTLVELQTAIKAFTDAALLGDAERDDQDVQQKFEDAKTAWLVAREPYGQTEVYRFRNGPINNLTIAGQEVDIEGLINAWPLGEALIDAVVNSGDGDSDFTDDEVGVSANGAGVNPDQNGDGGAVDGREPNQNLIATSSITIDKALLGNDSINPNEADVISGYHAIEFLLWGQDLNDSGAVTDGSEASRLLAIKSGIDGGKTQAQSGSRQVTDFTTAPNAERRRLYLNVAIERLVDDLNLVDNQWATNGAHYQSFTTVADEDDAKAKIAKILFGMGTLSKGELAGERMQIAFSVNSQEDEHSCFSDNTHRDIALNAEGVSNSFTGTYDGYDANLDGLPNGNEGTVVTGGKGIKDLLEASNLTSTANELATLFNTTEEAYTRIDQETRVSGRPFDVQIAIARADKPGKPIGDTILALNNQADKIAEAAEQLGISFDDLAEGGNFGDFGDDTDCVTSNPTQECTAP